MGPKLKIGESATAGHNNDKGMKRFTNGHKSFTAQEAKCLLETQARENKTMARFDANKYSMTRSRNPLTGEPTPRPEDGLFGFPLMEHGRPESSNTSGGSAAMKSPSKESNPLKRTDMTLERVTAVQNLQDTMTGELEYLQKKIQMRQEYLKTVQPSSQTRF